MNSLSILLIGFLLAQQIYVSPSISGVIVYNVVVNVYVYDSSLDAYVPYLVFETNLPVHVSSSGDYAVDATGIRIIVHSVSGPMTRKEIERQAHTATEIIHRALINWSRSLEGAKPVSHEYLLVAGRIVLAYKAYLGEDTVLYDEKTHVVLGGSMKRNSGEYMYAIRLRATDADENLAASMNTVEPPPPGLLLSASTMILIALLVMIGNNLSKWKYYIIS